MKTIFAGVILVAGAAVALIGTRDAWDYFRVGRDGAIEAIDGQIPFSVKKAKLQLMTDDAKKAMIASQRKVAEISVDVKRGKTAIEKLSDKLNAEKNEMAAIRSRLPGGSNVHMVSTSNSANLGVELNRRLDAYRLSNELLESKKTAVAELEKNMGLLENAMRDRKNVIAKLETRLQSIETVAETIKFRNGGNSLPSDDDIQRALVLADTLEKKLEVEQHVLYENFDRFESAVNESAAGSIDSATAFDVLFGVANVSTSDSDK